MIEIIITLSTIFATIVIGYIGCKIKLVSNSAQKYLTEVLLNISIPCMLLYSISNNEIKDGFFAITIEMLAFSIAYFAFAAMISILLIKMFRVRDGQSKGAYQVIFTSINTGFIGFPVTTIIFGEESLYYMVLHNIILNICLYSICIKQLNKDSKGKKVIIETMKKLANPCIISACGGLALLFFGLHLPNYINIVIQPIGDATIPFAMIIVGLQLADGKITDCFHNKKLVLFSFVTMIIWPLLVFLLINYLPVYKMIKIALILGAALPPATTISALASQEQSNYLLAADGIVVTTLMSAISIPMIAMILT